MCKGVGRPAKSGTESFRGSGLPAGGARVQQDVAEVDASKQEVILRQRAECPVIGSSTHQALIQIQSSPIEAASAARPRKGKVIPAAVSRQGTNTR